MLARQTHRSGPERRARRGAVAAGRTASAGRRPDTPDGWVTAVRTPAGRRRPGSPHSRTAWTRGCGGCSAAGASSSSTPTRPRPSTRAGRPARGHHHAHRVGQDALLQRAGAERDPPRSVQRARCICFRRRRSRRISWPSCTSCRAGSSRPGRAGDRRLHLRRRHAAGCAPRHPRARARGAEQPRHDPLGHPAAPSALGEAVREPALRRRSTSCTPIAACSAAT